jgi:hypothetical protein
MKTVVKFFVILARASSVQAEDSPKNMVEAVVTRPQKGSYRIIFGLFGNKDTEPVKKLVR